MVEKLFFDFCCKSGICVQTPHGEHLCYKCNTPFQKDFHEKLNGNEWIAVRFEESHCILIGKYESQDEAQYYALMDYAILHKKEPLSTNLATMIPNNISKSDMLLLFYGIDMKDSMADELSIKGEFEDNGTKWKVGRANTILLNNHKEHKL